MNHNNDGPVNAGLVIVASMMCGFLFGVTYGHGRDLDTDTEEIDAPELETLDSGCSRDADLTAFWIGDAALTSSNYAVLSGPSDLIFSVHGEDMVRLHPDGGVEVHGKSVKTKAAVCDGLQEWIKAEGYGGQR